MDLDAKKIGIYVRRGLIFSIRVCCRSAYDHPFVVGMVIFSFLLYRFLPSLFSFLVSSSPVIFCTAVLLGSLLSLGNPDIPEVEEEEKKTHEISSLKAGGVAGDVIVEKDESFAVETRVEKREVEEEAIEEVGLDGEDVVDSRVEKEAISLMPCDMGEGVEEALIGRSIVIQGDEKEHCAEKEEVEERLYPDQGFYDNHESYEKLIERISETVENVEGHHTDDQEKENEGPADENFDILKENRAGASLVHSESDSDSDGAESSSPDASLAEIMPMLDELHPLLDSEAPQPIHIPIDDSDAVSQGSSHESEEGSAESVEDAENREEAHEDQKDKTEAIVKWTEDDQKNLMDLGTSELERNQRLENLIAKRTARKHQRMQFEKNLIDFDNNNAQTTSLMSGGLDHIQFQVPSISTVRRNPFDFPYDSNETGGLPPIPGSAPSVLLPRRNPFDLPFDQADDRASLSGKTSSYQEEFISVQQREMYFRRHENFTLGVPFSLESKQDKHEIKFQPYFTPEGVTSEEASHSTFQRQLSEMSDSKMSSVPDTDTASSIADQEQDHTLLRESHQEGEVISPTEHSVEPMEQENNSKVGDVEIERKENYIDVGDVHKVDFHASEIAAEVHDGISYERGTSPSVSVIDEEFIPSPGRPNVEVHEKSQVVEENYKGSSSSSSEANEKISEMNIDKELDIIEDVTHDSLSAHGGYMDLANAEGVDGCRVETPVFDRSLSDIENSLSDMTDVVEGLSYMDKRVFSSTSSISSETHIEILERSAPPMTVERSFLDRIEDPISDNVSVEQEVASGNEVLGVASSSLSGIQENELQSREIIQIGESDQTGHSAVHQNDDFVEALVTQLMIEQVSQGLSSSSWETKLTESGLVDGQENEQFKEAQTSSSTFDEEIHVGGYQLDAESKMDTATATYPDGVLLSDASQQTQLFIEESASLLSFEGPHEETQDLISLQIKSTGQINDDGIQKLVQEPEDGFSSKEMEESMESSIILKSKQKSMVNFVDSNYDALDQVQSEQEVHENLITVENEEAEEIKEIDEGLLLELDAVGDFSIKEPISTGEHLKSDLQFDEQTRVDISTDSLIQMEECQSLPEHQLWEAVEVQLTAGQSKLMESEVACEERELVDQDFEPKESSSELQVLEAVSVADTDLAFKQLHEGEFKKLDSLESIDDKPLSVIAEVGSPQLELEERILNLREIDSELHVLEARSLEDIDSAFKPFHEGDGEKFVPVKSIDDETKQVESEVVTEPLTDENDLEVGEIHLDVHGAEGRSLEDVNSGFKQIHQEDLEKSSYFESVNNAPELVEFEVESTDSTLGMKQPQLIEMNSEMHVLGAGSLEETNLAVKKSHEINSEQSINANMQFLHSEEGFAESTSDQNHSKPSEIHPELLVLEARSVEDFGSAFKQMQQGEVERHLSLESVEDQPHYVESEVGSADFTIENNPSNLIEIHSDLHVLEAESLADIDSAFKELRGPEKSVSIEPKESEIESAEYSSEKKVWDSIEIHSDLHVLEARSPEDIQSLNKLHGEGLKKALSFESSEDKPKPLESEEFSTEFVPDTKHLEANDTHLVPQIPEVTALLDNDSTSKQLHEVDIEKSITLEPLDEKLQMESDVRLPEKNILELTATDSAMQASEARSMKVTQLDPKQQVSGGSVEDPPKPIESEDKPADFEAIERHLEPIILMRSAEEVEAALKESAACVSGTSSEELSAAKANKGVTETCDDSSSRSSASRERCKKEGSSKSSSSSSTSSSSSSSSSDSE